METTSTTLPNLEPASRQSSPNGRINDISVVALAILSCNPIDNRLPDLEDESHLVSTFIPSHVTRTLTELLQYLEHSPTRYLMYTGHGDAAWYDDSTATWSHTLGLTDLHGHYS